MSYQVDFVNVSTVGLESSPVAAALAGLRANEARYFKNKYDHVFTVEPAAKAKKTIDWVHRILEEERDIVIASPPARGDDLRGREHPVDLRVLRERALDQRAVPARRAEEASGRVQALRRDGGPRRARLLQVRETEVEAGRDDPRLVLRDQGRRTDRRCTRSSGAGLRPRPGRSTANAGAPSRSTIGSQQRAEWYRPWTRTNMTPLRCESPIVAPHSKVSAGLAHFERVRPSATRNAWSASAPSGSASWTESGTAATQLCRCFVKNSTVGAGNTSSVKAPSDTA